MTTDIITITDSWCGTILECCSLDSLDIAEYLTEDYSCYLHRLTLPNAWEDMTTYDRSDYVDSHGKELCLGDYV